MRVREVPVETVAYTEFEELYDENVQSRGNYHQNLTTTDIKAFQVPAVNPFSCRGNSLAKWRQWRI